MLKYWLNLAKRSLGQPRETLREVLDMGFTAPQAIMMLVFLSVVGVLVMNLATLLVPAEQQAVVMSPLSLAAVQLGVVLATSGALRVGGFMFGGKGDWRDCVVAMTWLEFLMFLVQLAQIVIILVVPPLTLLVMFAAVAIMFYLLVNFVMEVHGFTNPLSVVAGLIVAMFAIAFVLALLAAMFGVFVVGVDPNV